MTEDLSPPPRETYQSLIDQSIREDHALQDTTTRSTLPRDRRGAAIIRTRESCMFAGGFLLTDIFEEMHGSVEVDVCPDGTRVDEQERVATLRGSIQTLLSAERIALNFLQRTSGIATRTAAFVEAVRGTDASVLDTRKTVPGWRTLDKYAVRAGGGRNHRMHLEEMVLIKENHLSVALADEPDLSLSELVHRVREQHSEVPVEVEVESMEQLKTLAEGAKPDYVLLDNMTVEQVRDAVDYLDKFLSPGDDSFRTEASGGIDLDRVRDYAQTGVDRISIGRITHSVSAVDFTMQLNEI